MGTGEFISLLSGLSFASILCALYSISKLLQDARAKAESLPVSDSGVLQDGGSGGAVSRPSSLGAGEEVQPRAGSYSGGVLMKVVL